MRRTGEFGRWLVIALLFFAILVNYVDRSNLSIAAVPLMKHFAMSPAAMGVLMGAFFWTYSLAQVPAGYLVDRFSLKSLYAGSFLLWSLASAGVGLATSFWQIFILRLILGAAETVAHPASIAYIRRNFCESEQGLPTALYVAGMSIGPAVGAFLGGLLLQRMGWQSLFLVTGLGACLWLAPWMLLAPTQGSERRNRQGCVAGPRNVWRILLTSRILCAIFAGAFFYTYYWYYYLTWVPSYLVMARGFSFVKMGLFTALPLSGMAVVSIIAGRIADRLIARLGRPMLIRKTFVITGFVAGSSIATVPLFSSSFAVVLTLLCSLLGIGLAAANYWALIQVISPRAAIGRVVGSVNTIANMAGICAPMITGVLVQRTKGFNLSILLAGACLLLAAGIFAFLVRENDAQGLHQRFGEA